MPIKPFDGPRLKLRRARYHIGDLAEQIRAYLKREPFYLEIEAQKPGENWAFGKKWTLKVREEVPPDFSAVIGDVVHNLRASLDVLACELVRANGQSDDGVYFPFADSAAELENMIARRAILTAPNRKLLICYAP